jgi:hypothetical protein
VYFAEPYLFHGLWPQCGRSMNPRVFWAAEISSHPLVIFFVLTVFFSSSQKMNRQLGSRQELKFFASHSSVHLCSMGQSLLFLLATTLGDRPDS